MRKTALAAMRRRLHTSRIDAGHTTTSLAQKLGTTHSTIVRWERGDTEPRASDLLRWAESCDVSASWLLCGSAPACTWCSERSPITDVGGLVNATRPLPADDLLGRAKMLVCGSIGHELSIVTPERRESEPRETIDDTLACEASRLRDLDPVER
jgi:DNA-binding XRE family transcriptional regulator